MHAHAHVIVPACVPATNSVGPLVNRVQCTNLGIPLLVDPTRQAHFNGSSDIPARRIAPTFPFARDLQLRVPSSLIKGNVPPPRPRAPNLEFGITTTERENHEPPKAPHRCPAYTARIGAMCVLGSVRSSLEIVSEVVAGRECDLGTVNLTPGPQI